MKNENTIEFEKVNNVQLIIGWLVVVPLFMTSKQLLFVPITSFLCNGLNEEIAYLIANWLFQLAMCTILVCLFKDSLKESVSVLKKLSKSNIMKSLIKGVILLLATMFFCVLMQYVIRGGNIIITQNESGLRSIKRIMPVPIFFLVTFLGPLSEELVFRGIVYRTFRKMNAILAVMISAIMFGTIHFLTSLFTIKMEVFFVEMIPYVGIGIVLAVIYEKKRNIVLCICIHMIYNGLLQLR